MSVIAALVALGFFLAVSYHYWDELHGEERILVPHEFCVWAYKGLLVPLLVWLGLNSGLLPDVPTLLVEVDLARASGGNWLPQAVAAIAPSLAVIGSYWAAATFLVMLAEIWTRTESQDEFKSLAAFWCIVLVPVVWSIGCLQGPAGLGFALMIWLLPITHFTVHLARAKKSRPSYARAVAKLKFGKYQDAELAVLGELEKCESDFEGWMMLAELYASHFHELEEADFTVRELCDQPSVTPLQISLAFHRLADWHLKLGENPAGAREALAEICQRVPGSHFARMAQQRLEQLPSTREELRHQLQGKTIQLPALIEDMTAETEAPPAFANPEEARREANRLVAQLEAKPDDVPAREKLAAVFAQRLDRADLAVEQLELLVELPGPPDAQKAEWLSRMAAWRFRSAQDWEAARPLLERLVHDFPQSPQAFAAQRRLGLMNMERRIAKTST